MKPIKRKWIVITFIIVGVVSLFFLILFISTSGLSKREPTFVEQIPFGEVLEIEEFEEAEFYNSTNEFIGAEIRLRVRYTSHIEPSEKLPPEYILRQAYSRVDTYVKEITSLEMLDKMKEAFADNKYLKLVEGKGIHASFGETKINNKIARTIEKIFVKPDSYHFVKY